MPPREGRLARPALFCQRATEMTCAAKTDTQFYFVMLRSSAAPELEQPGALQRNMAKSN
jgi:hypothetical protein